jgi:hypothetical protein
MKRIALLIGAAMVAVIGYGIAAHHSSASADITLPDSAYSAPAMNVSFVHQGDPGQDRPFLPNGAPAISREDAISVVEQTWLIGDTGYTIHAKYGLLTAPEQSRHADGSVYQVYDNTPVWAVRVDNLKQLLPGPPHHAAPSTTHFVYLVDPATGQAGASYAG